MQTEPDWWRLIAPPGGGTSGSTRPTGTGPTFQDKKLTWSCVGPANWRTLLNEPAILDTQRMGSFFDSIDWQKLVPSGLGGLRTVVTAGGGSYASWSDGQPESGGLDWVALHVNDNSGALGTGSAHLVVGRAFFFKRNR